MTDAMDTQEFVFYGCGDTVEVKWMGVWYQATVLAVHPAKTMTRMPTYDVFYDCDEATELGVGWCELRPRAPSAGVDPGVGAVTTRPGPVERDPVAVAVDAMIARVVKDPVVSVVLDLRAQLRLPLPADIVYDPFAATALRGVLARHGDFVFDLMIISILIVTDPPCRRAFLVAALGMLRPAKAPESAAEVVQRALGMMCADLDAEGRRRVNALNVGRTKTMHGPAMALKFLGTGDYLWRVVATLHGRGRTLAAIARLGPAGTVVDADVAAALFGGLAAELSRVAPPVVNGRAQGCLGCYGRAWLITRAAAFLGLSVPATPRTTWHEATRVLGYVDDVRLPALAASRESPLGALAQAGHPTASVWMLPIAMCLQRGRHV